MGYVMQYGIKKAYKNIGNIKNMAYESKTSYSFWKITGIAAAAFFVLGCICVFYGEFAIIRSNAGLNSYKISVKEWTEKTNAIGIFAKAGR